MVTQFLFLLLLLLLLLIQSARNSWNTAWPATARLCSKHVIKMERGQETWHGNLSYPGALHCFAINVGCVHLPSLLLKVYPHAMLTSCGVDKLCITCSVYGLMTPVLGVGGAKRKHLQCYLELGPTSNMECICSWPNCNNMAAGWQALAAYIGLIPMGQWVCQLYCCMLHCGLIVVMCWVTGCLKGTPWTCSKWV